jgi:Protein of unknown function DUF262
MKLPRMAKGSASAVKEQLDREAADAQIKQKQSDVDYDTKDFTVDYLIKAFQDDYFYIPEYQRKFVWDPKRKRRFIESVLLGLPIPFLFIAEMDDGRLEIVDGAQRVQTLEAFVSGDLVLEGLEKLPALNGFHFSDLPDPQQRKFSNRALRMIVLDESTALDVRQDIFDRINTGSLPAKAGEVRKGAFGGPFYDVIQDCANNADFLKLCPITENVRKRGEAEELVLRFFAYSDSYKKFQHDVTSFLDNYIRQHRDTFDGAEMTERFSRMIAFVGKHFPYGFAKTDNSKATPRVRFEAISVGVHLALKEDPELVPPPVDWLDSPDFKQQTTTHASNSGPKLRARIEYVRDRLIGE